MGTRTLTWDAVLEVVNAAGSGGITNAQIATHFTSVVADVTQLTRLMAQAGVICRNPVPGSIAILYTPIK